MTNSNKATARDAAVRTRGETVNVTEGVFTFVALGDDGRPCKVKRAG